MEWTGRGVAYESMTGIERVHITHESGGIEELTPPHPPREETPAYRAAHHRLVDELDSPCAVCGVRRSTLGDPASNSAGARDLETHHYPIERSLVSACDWRAVAARYPDAGIVDDASLLAWVDSPANLMVLCDVHHRSRQRGIHHLLMQEFGVLPFLLHGYTLVATTGQEEDESKADEAIVEKAMPQE